MPPPRALAEQAAAHAHPDHGADDDPIQIVTQDEHHLVVVATPATIGWMSPQNMGWQLLPPLPTRLGDPARQSIHQRSAMTDSLMICKRLFGSW